MMDMALLECPAGDCDTGTDCPNTRPDHDAQRDAGRLTQEIVARFVQNPLGFAEAANVDAPSAFVQTYLKGIDRRLSDVIGQPQAERQRIATLGAPSVVAPADWLEDPASRIAPEDIVTMPHMGVVAVVACAAAVVSACAAVVTACVAIGVLSRKPIAH